MKERELSFERPLYFQIVFENHLIYFTIDPVVISISGIKWQPEKKHSEIHCCIVYICCEII